MGRVINLLDRRIQQLMKEGVPERHKKGLYPFLSNVIAYVRKQKLGAEVRLAEIDPMIEVYEKRIFTKSRI